MPRGSLVTAETSRNPSPGLPLCAQSTRGRRHPLLHCLGSGRTLSDWTRGVCAVPRLLDVCPWSGRCSRAGTPAGTAAQGQGCWGPRRDARLPHRPQAAPGCGRWVTGRTQGCNQTPSAPPAPQQGSRVQVYPIQPGSTCPASSLDFEGKDVTCEQQFRAPFSRAGCC